jgi:ferrous iron transport protein B
MKIILVGNSNVGKSVIFRLLTGRYVTVSNYPGTTVEIAEGRSTFDRKIVVVDTPGINNLIPMSEDERVTRDILLEKDVHVLQVIDAKNLQRGLLITLQLIEMGVPLVLSLNMEDEARSRGIVIDFQRLSQMLGIDVVPTVAIQKKGIRKLIKCISNPRISSYRIAYSRDIEEGVKKIVPALPDRISKKGIALMLLSGDESLRRWMRDLKPKEVHQIEKIIQEVQAKSPRPVSLAVTKRRLDVVREIIGATVKKTHAKMPMSEMLGSVAIHPVFGLPLLFVVLLGMYFFVGKLGAGILADSFEGFFEEHVNPLSKKAIGIVPFKIIQRLFVGEYGIITMALTYSLGIILPIVATFFIAFGILEDSGYLSRLAMMVDKIFRAIGLHGKAVLPMVLGLGCVTMATISARVLETKKERMIVTFLLALGVPCSAQLGVILGMLGGLPGRVMFIWAGVVIGVVFILGFLASKALPGRRSDFILELPPLRMPQISNIGIKTLARVEWYLKEAVPLFILGTLVLFALSEMGLLPVIESLASPLVVKLLGLPEKATEAFILGFLRRDYGAAGLFMLAKTGQMDAIQALVSMVTITLFVPCIANFFVIIKERGIKAAMAIALFIFPFAFFIGGMINFLLRLLG